jgi:EpsI family protein
VAIRTWIVVLIVGVSGVYARQLGSRTASSPGVPQLERLPTSPAGWSGQDYPMTGQVAAVLAADATVQRRYRHRDGREVWLFVAYFANQAVNSQIHSPRHCVPGNGWNIVSLEDRTVSLPQSSAVAARMLIEKDGHRQEMTYWFLTRGGVLTGEYAMKWDLLKSALARRPTDAAFIRYSAAVEDTGAMHELMAVLDDPLREILGAVGLR